MTKKDIQELLQEGFEENGTIEGAFDYLLEGSVRDVFEMNNWDEPKFSELVITFQKKKYKVTITEDGCCEATNDHRIMYWKWSISEL
jgi:hypothetical protein